MAEKWRKGWQLSADTGGTFTDCIGWAPDGSEHRLKVLSSGSLRGSFLGMEGARRVSFQSEWIAPSGFCSGFEVWVGGQLLGSVADDTVEAGWLELTDDFKGEEPPSGSMLELKSGLEAPVLAARLMTLTNNSADMPPLELRLGTTRGTNALLENKGAKVAFLVSSGFADLCRIGDQRRPDLFSLKIEKPEPLHHHVIEVAGRVALNGSLLEPFKLEAADLASGIEAARAAGCTVAAVALLNSYRHPEHEAALVEHLRQQGGFDYVVGSSELRPFIHYLRRAETAIVDATLGPVMEAYLNAVEEGLGTARLRVMTSSGELLSRARFRPVDSLLSGPAGGVAGAALAGRRAGLQRLIAFDMGGTSTDVSRWDGDFAYQSEQRVGAARVLSRSVKIETVAAGGGSICRVDGGRIFVGPESAGASPGPACYGAGGPLTVTDVNLLLGRLDPGAFQIPVSLEAAEQAWLAMAPETADDAWLAGLLQLANERMAQAIRQISVRDGYDPADFGLVAFGGAGGMHACAVAEILGIRTLVFPRNAGLLSAEGLAHTALASTREQQMLCSIGEWERKGESILDGLRRQARADLEEEGITSDVGLRETVLIDLRLRGQESTLTVEAYEDLDTAFIRQFVDIFGYDPPDPLELELVAVRFRLASRESAFEEERFSTEDRIDDSALKPLKTLQTWFENKRWETPVFGRDALPEGIRLQGPALVTDPFSTLVVAPGWVACKGHLGSLRLERLHGAADEASTSASHTPENVRRELLLHRFEGLVEEMGEQLRRTALSTNIRERLDFSCALLDAEGTLLVNAPHIPVHLGALGECVRRVMERLPLRPGDVIVTNHPGFGGSHLPDVTVISGVFAEGQLVAVLANRAHHAEIGGMRPGSMPPAARCLAEEGVVIQPRYLIEAGASRFAEIESLLRGGDWPSRAVSENLADLQAQVAANRRGARILQAMIEAEGKSAVEHFLRSAAELSEAAATRKLISLGTQDLHAVDALDDGTPIEVRAMVKEGRLRLDFTGTGPVHPGNFNATPAIVRSAVLYVLRLLVGENLPLNEGMLRPVEIKLPGCFLNPGFPDDPRQCPAVVGGNVETSQRMVDVLLSAFGLVAQSQGTMNNVLFGDDTFGYYETVGGGSGAGDGFDGASGVHVHMTNTAITDPEILEHRYPLRILRFALRRSSGGQGQWYGGDGLIREYAFLRPMHVSLLAQRRERAPKGVEGGADGTPGKQTRIYPDGRMESLSGLAAWDPQPGERLILETPGGGGWGRKKEEGRRMKDEGWSAVGM